MIDITSSTGQEIVVQAITFTMFNYRLTYMITLVFRTSIAELFTFENEEQLVHHEY